MKNLITLLMLSICTVGVTNIAHAGVAEVTWTNVDKYTDIRAGNEHRGHFKDRIFKAFEEHFLKLSEQLPDGQLLKVNVTNVDLAGDVRFDTMDDIRVIKDMYIPSMKFTYQLLNGDKSLEQSGEVNLKDMAFLMGSNSRYKNKTIPYEKQMLDKWFKKTFFSKS